MKGIKRLLFFFVLLVTGFNGNSAEDRTDSLLQAFSSASIPSDRLSILNTLAGEYINTDPIRAENFASQALLIAESIQDKHGTAVAKYHLGRIAQLNEDYTKAMEYLGDARKVFIEERDKIWMANVALPLSDEYKRQLEYDAALEMLFQARETFFAENDEKKLALTLNAIGGNYYDQGIYEKAFEYYANSLEILKKSGDIQTIGSLYNNIGEIYRIKKDYTKAISNYKKALVVFIQFNDKVRMALLYTNMGDTYFERNNLDSAEYYLGLGRELSDLSGNTERMSSIRISLGKLARARGDWQTAHDKIKEGYNMAALGSSYNNMILAARILSELYEQKGEYEKAYNYFVRYRSLDDSIHDIRSLEAITKMEMNLIYDLEKDAKKIKVQQSNLWYFTIAFILVSIIVVIVLFYGRQRIRVKQAMVQGERLRIEKMQLEEEIDHKNRELATNVMFLVKKNELINFISEKLMKVKSDFKPSIRSSVDDILVELQSNLDENIWQVFEERFREVHKDFYSNLVNKFPNLTENERKLCAFIRLNMNTKEIAAITHQNPGSIEVARTRLRKKLNISNTDISLNGFLSNF